jgi:hypothetical protein
MPKKAIRKRKRVTPEMIEKMSRLRKEGLSQQAIAKRLGVTPMTARKYLKPEAPVAPVEKPEAPPEVPVGFSNTHERKAIPAVIIVAVVLIIVAAAVASAGYYLMNRRGGPAAVAYKTYTNENYSIKFDYPENWAFTSLDLAELQMYGLSPPMVAYFDAGSNTGLTGEVQLRVFDKVGYENLVPGDLDNLTSYVASLENQLENNENLVLRSGPTVVTVDSHNGVRVMATALQTDNVRFELETVVKDNYFYAFEIAAPEENYSSVYTPIFDRVIGSFSLLG